MPLPAVPERYEALEVLSRGEAGVAVRARDRTLQREVVLKLPPEPMFLASSDEKQREADARERERILREARALARVQHPNVERLLDVIETPAGPVLVMEPSNGETLAERLARDGRLDAASVRDIALQVLGALAAVHAIGILHRGIGIDQILLCTDGSVRLTGFTFAKLGSTGLSMGGMTFLQSVRSGGGRGPAPPHPAPEQIRKQKADARADLFGLGWVLYESLTGQQPYPIELDIEQWVAPKDPHALVSQTPKDFSQAVMKCLAISPLKRFASAGELKAALDAMTMPSGATGGAPGGHASHAGARGAAGGSAQDAANGPLRSASRKPLLVAAGALVVLVGAFFGWKALAGPAAASAGDQTRGLQQDGGRGLAGVRSSADRHFSGAPYASLHAVIIGIDKYERWPQLSYAVADASAIGKLLVEKFGFLPENVTELINEQATRDEIRHVLGGEMKLRTKKEDGVFVFFAGHGQTEDLPRGGQTGYLVPVGGMIEEERNQETLIPMGEIEAYARKMPAKHVFFAIDACFSGLVTNTRGMAAEEREYVGYLAREPARLVLTAGGKDQQVSETAELGHSYFTSRVLHGLDNESADVDRNGVITAGELASYVQTNVPKDTFRLKQPQVPQYTSLTNDEGQFMFLTSRVRTELEMK